MSVLVTIVAKKKVKENDSAVALDAKLPYTVTGLVNGRTGKCISRTAPPAKTHKRSRGSSGRIGLKKDARLIVQFLAWDLLVYIYIRT